MRSRSSGVAGRAISNARNHHFVLDSSTTPKAASNHQALSRGHLDTRVALQRMEVTVSGVQTTAEPNRIQRLDRRVELVGVTRDRPAV